MKKYLSIIFTLTNILILSSCSNHIKEPEQFNKSVFENSRKGIVFFAITENTKSMLKQENVETLQYHLKKLGDNKTIYNVLAAYNYNYKNGNPNYIKENLLFLEPGIYYINYISLLSQGYTTRWYPAPGINKNIIKYGAFEVKANQVLSIGRLDITNYKLINEDEVIKNQLENSSFSYLSKKIKPGMFFPAGSKILKANKN